jgi:hypothetical protein
MGEPVSAGTAHGTDDFLFDGFKHLLDGLPIGGPREGVDRQQLFPGLPGAGLVIQIV